MTNIEEIPLTPRGYIGALEDLACLWAGEPEPDEGRTFAAQLAAQETGLVNTMLREPSK